jgi:fructose-bisphosphate aldolase class 1
MAISKRLEQCGVKETDEKFDKLQYEIIPTSDKGMKKIGKVFLIQSRTIGLFFSLTFCSLEAVYRES